MDMDREERADLAQPKPTGVKLGRPCPWVGPNRSPLGPNLGLTCPELGPVVGSNLAQLGSNMAQRGHVWTQVGLNVRNLPAWGHLVPKLGPRLLNAKRHRCLENVEIPVKTGVLRISYCPVMSPMLKRCGGPQLAPSGCWWLTSLPTRTPLYRPTHPTGGEEAKPYIILFTAYYCP